MTVEPLGGASVVVFPAISRLISSNARISYDGSIFGSIPVKKGPLNMDLNSGIKRLSDGDAEVPLFSFDTSQAKVKGVPATEAGKVEVVAFGPLGDRGKPGRANFKALRKQTTRLLPYKELGYATPFAKELGPKGKGHKKGNRAHG